MQGYSWPSDPVISPAIVIQLKEQRSAVQNWGKATSVGDTGGSVDFLRWIYQRRKHLMELHLKSIYYSVSQQVKLS